MWRARLGDVAAVAALGIGGTYIYRYRNRDGAVVFDRFDNIQQQNENAAVRHEVVEGTPFAVMMNDVVDCHSRSKDIRIPRLTTKDLRKVDVQLTVLSKPDPEKLGWVITNFGQEYENVVFPALGLEIMKDVTARYESLTVASVYTVLNDPLSLLARHTAADLSTLQEQVAGEIESRLAARAKSFEIIVERVSDISVCASAPDPPINRAEEDTQRASG
jgi:hypothetical protein